MRTSACLLVLSGLAALPLAAQTHVAPRLIGVEAPAAGGDTENRVETGAENLSERSLLESDAGAPLRALAAGTGSGLSGALRVVLAEPGQALAPHLLTTFGEGWEEGHRWAHPEIEVGPRVLGEPAEPAGSEAAYLGAGLLRETIHAPSEAGVWSIENGLGATATVITVVPAASARSGRLNGYHIGTYPTAGSGRSDAYAPPTGFIEVTPENQNLRISEHLTLRQFLTKDQFDVWPKYLALDMRLVDKLELVMQELNAMGVRAEGLHVMSGFRTPQYNGPGGGGRASLSRHMWGDAADVWIDNFGTGRMDDLNGDGRIDIDDAAVIMRAVERVERRYPELIGGAGTYPANDARGPYIHIDARGYHSRW